MMCLIMPVPIFEMGNGITAEIGTVVNVCKRRNVPASPPGRF